MKFVIDNEVYYLNFIHTPPVLEYSNKMAHPREIVVDESGTTTAIMYTFDKFSEKKVLCEQTAFCHPNDKYSKIKGRKESIKKIFNNPDNNIIWSLDKDARYEFWKQYFAQVKEGVTLE